VQGVEEKIKLENTKAKGAPNPKFFISKKNEQNRQRD